MGRPVPEIKNDLYAIQFNSDSDYREKNINNYGKFMRILATLNRYQPCFEDKEI